MFQGKKPFDSQRSFLEKAAAANAIPFKSRWSTPYDIETSSEALQRAIDFELLIAKPARKENIKKKKLKIIQQKEFLKNYSEFDASGIPKKDDEGFPLSKGKLKVLTDYIKNGGKLN